MFGWLVSSDLKKRAKLAAEQMMYFQSITRKLSFEELGPSAERAGFVASNNDPFRRETSFHWADGEPDFGFFVQYGQSTGASIIAESYSDIFGLVMISNHELPGISVETKSAFGVELGRNAIRFRNILLGFPGFDGGTEDILAGFGGGKA